MLASTSRQPTLPPSLAQALKSERTSSNAPPTASSSARQSAALGHAGSPGRTRRSGAGAAAMNGGASASSGRAATLFSSFLRCMSSPFLQRCTTASARVSAYRLHRLDQLRGGLLRIAIQHAGVVEIKQRVLDAREAGALAALDDDDVLRLV